MTTWAEVEARLLTLPARQVLRLDVGELASPRSAGYEPSAGFPIGQAADYRKAAPGGGCFHAREFPGAWEVHRDEADPERDPVGHLFIDVIGAGDLPVALSMILIIFLIHKVFD